MSRPDRVARPRVTEDAPARGVVRERDETAAARSLVAFRLQRSAGNRTTALLLRRPAFGAAPLQRARDLHGNAAEPDAADQQSTLNTLAPGAYRPAAPPPPPPPGGSAPAPAPPTPARWTGLPPPGQRGLRRPQRVARRRLRRALRRELLRHLNARMTGINARVAAYNRRRMPMSSFEGAGAVAKTVTDAEVGSYVSSAAATPSQQSARHAHRFTATGAGRNLLDAFDPRDRALAGTAVSAAAVLWWMVNQDNAPTIKQAENFSHSRRGSVEQQWLWRSVIRPLARLRRRDLENYDRFGFALAPDGGRVLIGGMATAGDQSRAATPAEVRMRKYEAWETLVHEYIHTLEHSAHEAARANTAADGVLNEGMTEHFAHRIINAAIPRVRGDAALRRQIEGIPAGDPVPPLTTAVLHATYPVNSTYAPHVTKIRALTGVSEEAKRAAYFQGHIEYLGFTPAGQPATPVAAGTRGAVTVPSGVASLRALATLTGVTEATIRAANGSITTWSPMPRRVRVPGWRDHVVVAASDATTSTPETPAQIATQHGTTEAEVARVNRSRFPNWPVLAAGDRLLVPSGSGSSP